MRQTPFALELTVADCIDGAAYLSIRANISRGTARHMCQGGHPTATGQMDAVRALSLRAEFCAYTPWALRSSSCGCEGSLARRASRFLILQRTSQACRFRSIISSYFLSCSPSVERPPPAFILPPSSSSCSCSRLACPATCHRSRSSSSFALRRFHLGRDACRAQLLHCVRSRTLV